MTNKVEYILYLMAVILLVVTAYFYFADGGGDRVFAPFILACAAAFLGYRFRLKARVTDYLATKNAQLDDNSDPDEDDG